VTQHLLEEALSAALTLHERAGEAAAEAALEQAAAVEGSRARLQRIQENC